MTPSLKIMIVPILILLQGCAFNQNDDNQIYLVGRKFHFAVYYFGSGDSVQKIDSLELKVTDGFYPQRSQTAIDYTHYQKNENEPSIITAKETTGVMDGPDYFFIHPPREGDLHILSFAEFPSINTSAFLDTTSYTSSKGSVTMAKSYKGKTITKVETTQSYNGKTAIDIPFKKNLRVHHLEATATSEIGTIFGNYYFSEELGFVQMDYQLPDSTHISIRLTGIEFEGKGK